MALMDVFELQQADARKGDVMSWMCFALTLTRLREGLMLVCGV